MTVRPSRDHRPAWPPPSSAAGSHSLCKPAVSQSFSTKQPVNLLKLGQLQSWVHGPDWPPSPPAATKDRQVLCKICLNTCLGIFFYFPPLFCSEYLCWSNGMSICHTCFCAWQLALHQLAKYIYQCSKVAGFFRSRKTKCSSRMRGVMY